MQQVSEKNRLGGEGGVDTTRTKVVVLGANAFSGQDFIDLLLDDPKYEVIGVSRSPRLPAFRLKYAGRADGADVSRFRFMQLNMNRDLPALLAMLDAEQPSHIVNFAAQSEVAPSWSQPEDWFATNCVALAGLVNHLRAQTYLKRYLHISSPEVYGSCVGVVKEDARLNPSTPYAVSKAAADMLLEVYRKQYGFPLVSVRATNVYGARQQLFKIIPRSAIYLKLNRTIELHGGGRAVKSYIHIRDVSHGELAILERGRIGELYHLSPDQGVAVREVVQSICRHTGKAFDQAVRAVDERPGQDAAYVIDSTKARQELGWRPRVTLEEGLREVVEWVEKEWASIREQSLDYEHKA